MLYKEIKVGSGKSIKVYDDLFTYDQRYAFYNFCKNSFFKFTGYDSKVTEQQNDVTINSVYSQQDVEAMGILKAIKEPSIKEVIDIFPISQTLVNLSTASDAYHMHVDTSNKDIITMLYYVNMEWSLEWGGETIFFNDQGTDYEYVSAYKPGRLIMFDGEIPHMIRPPTFKANNLRMSFSCKFTKF